MIFSIICRRSWCSSF